jgi:hypothetical protein
MAVYGRKSGGGGAAAINVVSTGLTLATGTLTNDLSTGVAGGQSVVGGTAAGDDLTLSSTANGTKGNINLGTSTYDEVNNRLGIMTTTPAYALDVRARIVQFGSNNAADGTRTNATDQTFRVFGTHYLTAEEPVTGFTGGSTATENFITFGGGTGLGNAATSITFYTAATTTTLTGTARLVIGSTGAITFPASGTFGAFGVAAAAQQVSGANLTNNVTVGGTDNTIANYTDLTTYATDAAAIRNNIYQLARKLKQVNDGLRALGWLT